MSSVPRDIWLGYRLDELEKQLLTAITMREFLKSRSKRRRAYLLVLEATDFISQKTKKSYFDKLNDTKG